jgi:hypothetical protein
MPGCQKNIAEDIRGNCLNVGIGLRGPTMMTDFEPFVDVAQAARFLSLRPRRVLELARSGTLTAHPIGTGTRREWRFRLSELADAISRKKVSR